MSRLQVLLTGVAGAAAGALFTMPAAACVTDADCDEGLVCKTETYETDCAYPRDCPEGQTCEVPDCQPTEETYSYCDAPPCQTDADCGEGLICQIETYDVGCAVPDCPDGETCEPTACAPSTETYSYCTEPPCQVDADCGDGMICRIETYDPGCPPTPCAEGETCEPTACAPSTETYSYCMEKPCEADADCAEGLICKIETYEVGCRTAPCADGETCEPTDCVSSTETYSYCMEKPCEADADCAEGLICIEQTYESCSGGGGMSCDDAGNCTEIAYEESCTTETSAYCGYRYQAECTVAEDCGPGFDCVPEESCWCTGGTARPPFAGEAGAASVSDEPVSVDTECGCEPTGRNRCQLQDMPCTADPDCPADFSCMEGASACAVSSDGTTDCETPTMMCYPRGYGIPEAGGPTGGGGTPATGGSTGTGTGTTTGVSTGTTTGVSTGTGTGGPGQEPGDDDDDDNAGYPWGGWGDDDGSTPPAGTESGDTGKHHCPFSGGTRHDPWPPTPPVSTPPTTPAAPGSNDEGSAGPAAVADLFQAKPVLCSLGSAGRTSAGGAAWLGLLGLAALVRRRR